METIRKIISRYPEVSEVYIFGSRATGAFRLGSYIDLAIMDEGVDDTIISRLQQDFEDSSLPYFVDVICFSSLKHEELRKHIERFGTPIYSQSTVGA